MKLLPFVKKTLTHACVYYTVASLILYTGGMLASGIEREWIPTLQMMYMVFAFSALFSVVNQLVWNTSLPGVIKLLIHYVATTAIFYVMFILWGGYSSAPSSILVILLAYTFIYAAISLILFLIRTVFAMQKNNKDAYSHQFSKK